MSRASNRFQAAINMNRNFQNRRKGTVAAVGDALRRRQETALETMLDGAS
jgi:hypothetical protein